MKKTIGSFLMVMVTTTASFLLLGCGDGSGAGVLGLGNDNSSEKEEATETTTVAAPKEPTVVTTPASDDEGGGDQWANGEYVISGELYNVLNSPQTRWASEFEMPWMEGCVDEAAKVITRRDAVQYCACSILIISRLAPLVEPYVAYPDPVHRKFERIGGREYCNDQAMKLPLYDDERGTGR
jgi:hypothetical protein